MVRRNNFRIVCSIAVLSLVVGLVFATAQDSKRRGRKYKAPEATAKIEVTVLRDSDQKPIENAAVIFHTVAEKGNMELKTNEDGKTIIDVLAMGDTVRLQIIAKGYQTYGQDYKIEKDQMAIQVRMKRPGEQYSIYKSHPENSQNPDKPKEETKPNDKPNQ